MCVLGICTYPKLTVCVPVVVTCRLWKAVSEREVISLVPIAFQKAIFESKLSFTFLMFLMPSYLESLFHFRKQFPTHSSLFAFHVRKLFLSPQLKDSLLVLDDVWRAEVIRSFLLPVRLLVTTQAQNHIPPTSTRNMLS